MINHGISNIETLMNELISLIRVIQFERMGITMIEKLLEKKLFCPN